MKLIVDDSGKRLSGLSCSRHWKDQRQSYSHGAQSRMAADLIAQDQLSLCFLVNPGITVLSVVAGHVHPRNLGWECPLLSQLSGRPTCGGSVGPFPGPRKVRSSHHGKGSAAQGRGLRPRDAAARGTPPAFTGTARDCGGQLHAGAEEAVALGDCADADGGGDLATFSRAQGEADACAQVGLGGAGRGGGGEEEGRLRHAGASTVVAQARLDALDGGGKYSRTESGGCVLLTPGHGLCDLRGALALEGGRH